MKPVDPRLVARGRPTRHFLVLSVALGGVTTILVVAQAWLLATVLSGAIQDREGLATLRAPVMALLAVVVARSGLAWLSEVSAQRCSARVKSQLRMALVEHVARAGPGADVGAGTGDLAVLATRGVDALDGYYARYLPQLVLAVVVPVAVVVVVLTQDWVAAVIIAVTVPLVPVFMALVGWTTQQRTDRQLRTLQLLSGHFLDVVAGLTTLRVFGRSKAQVRTIRAVTDRYRETTMATLRLAFLSSLVLELLATVAVALVAVSVGLRLLHGHLGLHTSLFVLVLAPEAYLPLRQVGAGFHASAEGMAAAEQVFAVVERPLPERGTRTDVPDLRTATVAVDGVCVAYEHRGQPALDGCSVAIAPGEVVALTGPSGAGKSTLLRVLLGFVTPDAGRVRVGDVDLATLDPDAWRAHVAWVPQHPHLFAASLADNITLGQPGATPSAVRRAAIDAGLGDLLGRLPDGLDTVLGDGGAGLSSGERQRVALARAFLRDAPLLLLDEPTANLDGATEAAVLDSVRRLAAGRTVVLVAHRPALVALADRVVPVGAAEAAR